MKKIRIGLDVDGVLADLLTPLMKIASELIGKELHVGHVETWDLEELFEAHDALHLAPVLWTRASSPAFCQRLEPLAGAVEGVRLLQKVCPEAIEIFVVTSPLHDAATWTYDREIWLKEHFGIDRKHVVHTHDKSIFAGHMLVDDKPANVRAWVEAQIVTPRPAVLWDQGWNQDAGDLGPRVLRTRSWTEVAELADTLVAIENLEPWEE